MTKRLIGVLLSAVMILGLCGFSAGADYSGDYYYTVLDGKATLSGYDGTNGDIIVPSELGGYPVTAVKSNLGLCDDRVTSVTVMNGVETIGEAAFANCKNLSSVSLPESLTLIDSRAFSGCTNLESITVSPGNPVYHSANNCLIKTETKTLILACANSVIPDDGSVTVIANGSFAGKNLTSVTIPEAVTKIEGGAFSGCSLLTSITIPDSVTSIDADAFYNTAYVNNESNWDNGVLYISHHLVKVNDPYLSKNYSVRQNTVSIADSAFYNCTKLTTLTLPDSLKIIGAGAFFGCENLTGVSIPNGVTKIPNSAFSGCKRLETVSLPESVTYIGASAFSGCSSYNLSIEIPDGVSFIGVDAFLNTSYYSTSSNWENGVLYLGDYLIATKPNVVKGNCDIKDGTVLIAVNAFKNCAELGSVYIPDSVTYIGANPFFSCGKLTSIEVSPSNSAYHSSGNCLIETGSKTLISGCKSSVIPDGGSVEKIAESAFSSSGIAYVVIPDGVTEIGSNAFRSCMNLLFVTIPVSVKKINNNAFNSSNYVSEVYYTGSEEDWESISIGKGNDPILNAEKVFGFVPDVIEPVTPDPVEADVVISTWEELAAWAADSDDCAGKVVALAADVRIPTGAAWAAKSDFAGTFDGHGHKISGIRGSQGLCAVLSGATVKNLFITDAVITVHSDGVGSVAGTCSGRTTVSNVYSNAKIVGNTFRVLGGIIGCGTKMNTEPTTFESCWFDGEITTNAFAYAAGMIGHQNSSVVVASDCLNTGRITGTAYVAGISMGVNNGKLDAVRCVNAGMIIAANTEIPGCAITDCVGVNRENYGAYAKFVDCFGVKDMAGYLQVRELNTKKSDAKVIGEVAEVESVDALKDLEALSETWGLGADGMTVPKYFAAPETPDGPDTPEVPGDVDGDVNGDGIVDTVDLTLLRQYLADASTAIDTDAADVNGSGGIDTVDLTLIRQYLADNSVVLGPGA